MQHTSRYERVKKNSPKLISFGFVSFGLVSFGFAKYSEPWFLLVSLVKKCKAEIDIEEPKLNLKCVARITMPHYYISVSPF